MALNMARIERRTYHAPLSNPYKHYTFFTVDVILYTLVLTSFRDNLEAVRESGDATNFLVYFLVYRLFAFFLILKSIVNSNVYEYYAALLILLLKCVFVLIYILQKSKFTTRFQIVVVSVHVLINFLELLYLVIRIIIKDRKINLFLFRTSGVDPQINSK